jgi:cation diffusion facilitator CzcD-associated flavoprotein CzcO
LEEKTTVAIVGAGPAGLAVGACLRRTGVDFVILEKEHQSVPAWRRHYERLHLHTIKQYSSLPFVAFPKDFPRYVPRDLMVQYLDGYAAKFDLRPRFGETVRSVRRTENHWVVEGTSTCLLAHYAVIASGNNTEQRIPELAGIENFKGKVIHSADYVNARPFAGQSVLVMGMGNTGAEIALDLAEAGERPTVSVRNGVHIVPRELFGVPIQLVAMLATRLLSLRANDKLFPIILDFALGNLAKYGIKRPKQGLLQQIASSSRIPVIDVGTVRSISAGAIKIAPDVLEFTENGALFNDGKSDNFDAVIFATGYRSNYHHFLETDLQQSHRNANERAANSHLYFVGFHNTVSGLLREISKEAMQVAADIRRQSDDLYRRR